MAIIHIYGASGSGTSTLGKMLCVELGYYHLDTDDYYWLPTNPPFVVSRPVKERLELLLRDIHEKKNTIISGSLCGWGDEVIANFDLVIRLTVPDEVRIERLKKREFLRYGERISIGGDMHEGHLKFIKWAADYDNGDISMRSKALHDKWTTLIQCEIMILDGTLPTKKLVQDISTHLLCENTSKQA